LLSENIKVVWDDRGNIGKRYRYQDEIGTPHCITVDYETLENDTVTVRDRDTMEQERVKIEDLDEYLS
jgi:glycyl-tRNA synthetase